MSTFPTPSQIQERYLQALKALKPNFNRNDKNSDFVIRGRAFSGLASGLYGDQQKVNNDTYISSARYEALLLHGQDIGLIQQPSTKANSGQIRLTGVNGTAVGVGAITFLYIPTNIIYTNTTGGVIALGVLDVALECLSTGQVGNVIAPDTLQIVAPPTGVNSLASVLQSLADGADIETVDSYRQRLLSRRQQPPAGGNEVDYPNFAFEASPSVRSAFVRRFGRGLGTVDVYITTGTTDIDTAVTNGLAISRVPSLLTLATVQNYYNSSTEC